MYNIFGSYFSTQTREDLINLLCDKDMLINVLDDIQHEINNVKRDDLLHLVLDKSIRCAEDIGMHDVLDLLIRYDITIKRHFIKHTREEFIDLLQDDDELIDELHNIPHEIARGR